MFYDCCISPVDLPVISNSRHFSISLSQITWYSPPSLTIPRQDFGSAGAKKILDALENDAKANFQENSTILEKFIILRP